MGRALTGYERRVLCSTATLGRVCRHCACNDSETSWEANRMGRECHACYRRRLRSGECKCGRTLLGCHNKACPSCDAWGLWESGLIQIIMLAPHDDRERIIWRAKRQGAKNLGLKRPFDWIECITATPEQWASVKS